MRRWCPLAVLILFFIVRTHAIDAAREPAAICLHLRALDVLLQRARLNDVVASRLIRGRGQRA